MINSIKNIIINFILKNFMPFLNDVSIIQYLEEIKDKILDQRRVIDLLKIILWILKRFYQD